MASKRREVDNAPIVPSDAAAALDRYCPDLADWSNAWKCDQADITIGQRVVEYLKPFLLDLLQQGLAAKTLRTHRDNLWMLGGEVIRRRHDDPGLANRPAEDLLFELLEEDGGPLVWPPITESEQNSFDTTCRKLYRFLIKSKTGS
jgi:hypothetical protein